jgi:hypothetical protein
MVCVFACFKRQKVKYIYLVSDGPPEKRREISRRVKARWGGAHKRSPSVIILMFLLNLGNPKTDNKDEYWTEVIYNRVD